MISREQLATEFKVRKCVKQALTIVKKKLIKEAVSNLQEELNLRGLIQDLLLEEVSDDPHESTAINKLETLLINIMPVLEEAYKSLTTNTEQRESFRAHVLHAIRNSLAPVNARDEAGSGGVSELNEQDEVEEDSVTIDIDAPDEDKFIDLKKDEKEEEESDPRDEFGIEGEDETGRNVAYDVYKKIETQIVDTYKLLGDDDDKEIFYDYLLTNVKLNFDTYETDLQKVLSEPTTPEYEKEKQKLDADPGALGEPEGLEDPLEGPSLGI
jgi:hypothetical protein